MEIDDTLSMEDFLRIQNIMESYVSKRVNALYDDLVAENASFLSCDCENCRLDTICYVLNRTHSKYVVSGRGITHAMLADDSQLRADIDALVMDGIRIVNSAKRPYHVERVADDDKLANPSFVFPVFIGTVFDGRTFEPLMDVDVELKSDGELVVMEDCSWANPTKTYKATKGTYSFKPAVIKVESDDLTKNFSYSVTISAKGYQPLHFSFVVPVTSTSKQQQFFSIKLQDAYLFPEDEMNPMED
ncbi:MAG: late competence development ComFB family protein [Spirochaetaceae bacterium]|nr:late competence development ComFB family protein [Spirochaetaceae bacterium]